MPAPSEPSRNLGSISSARITRFSFPRNRVIGDSQVRAEHVQLGVLELETSDGFVGTGFFQNLFHPLPAESELVRQFEETAMPGLKGAIPAVLLNRLSRPRGGNNRALPMNFGEAINQALWDLHAQQLGLPLFRLLGATRDKVPAYASGLDFHLSDEDYVAFFGGAKAKGFGAFKIKVGHPDVKWDLNRLKLLEEAVGPGATIMVDANEAWTPKEAIRRLHIYRDAGHDIYWIEDPCIRDDYEGLRQVGEAVPFAHLNTGEYLSLHEKRLLIEGRAVDILNVHGTVSDVMKAAWLAAEYGVEISLGNTTMEIGVHAACALPECRWLEYSFQDNDFVLETPIRIEAGWAHAPDRPGHGLKLSDMARKEFRAPNVGDATPRSRIPRGSIPLPSQQAAE